MATQVTVDLPDHVYQRAQRLAEMTGRDISEIVVEILSQLPPLSSEVDTRPVESLTDDEVISLADGMMDADLSTRMSVLLNKQQAGTITDAEHAELKMLTEVYDIGQQRKTQALVEAIKRGLREPLNR